MENVICISIKLEKEQVILTRFLNGKENFIQDYCSRCQDYSNGERDQAQL